MTKKTTGTNKTAAPRTQKSAAPRATQTKRESMLALLRRDGGASLDEVCSLTSWQPHSTRAVFTGLRKKGFAFERTRTDGVTRYAITAEPSA